MNSISTTRRVLAVMAVTTALCADQAAMASPVVRPPSVEFAQLASRLVTRLAQNFQRTLPAIIREPARQQRFAPVVPSDDVYATAIASPHPPLSLFESRLPPPAL